MNKKNEMLEKLADEIINNNPENKAQRKEILEIGKLALKLDRLQLDRMITSMKCTLELSKIQEEITNDELLKEIKKLTPTQKNIIKNMIKEFK